MLSKKVRDRTAVAENVAIPSPFAAHNVVLKLCVGTRRYAVHCVVRAHQALHFGCLHTRLEHGKVVPTGNQRPITRADSIAVPGVPVQTAKSEFAPIVLDDHSRGDIHVEAATPRLDVITEKVFAG